MRFSFPQRLSRTPARIMVLSAALCGLLEWTAATQAEARPGHRRSMHGHRGRGPGGLHQHMLRLFSRLELTEDQEQALETLRTELQEQRRALRYEHRNAMETTVNNFVGMEPNREQLFELVESRTLAMQTHMKEAITKTLDFYDTLSDEQKQTLAELMSARAERMRARFSED